MAEGTLAKDARMLPHSIEQMCVTTPKMSKHASNLLGGDISAALSPPPTVELKQKRERSESLMLSQSNDMLATKRRLRSRSRLGLGPEDIPSAFMSPPCSTKPRERTLSRSQNELCCYPEEFTKRLVFNAESSSVYITPASETRAPLQNKDMNKVHCDTSFEKERLTTHLDYASDSSDDEGAVPCFEEKTRLKLNFDQYVSEGMQSGNHTITPDHSKIIGQRVGEKKINFIKELVDMNCEEICKQIFCYLEPRDLQRVASVSKLWRKICKKDRIASPRLDQFITGRKQHVLRKGKENLGHHTKFEYSVPQRPPFTVQDHNTIWTPEQKQSTTDIETVKTNILLTYDRIKCPSCGSPSRKTGNDTCECDECQEVFCSLCQYKVDNNHKTGKCAIKVTRSKTVKGKEAIGSKKSKERLKRY